MHKIVAGLIRENEGRKVPVTLFTKGGGMWLEAMAETGCDALGVDWTVNLAQAKARVGHKVALQGNMDPSVLYASPARIEQEVRSIWRILVRIWSCVQSWSWYSSRCARTKPSGVC